MQIQFNFANIPSSDALETHVRHTLDSSIGHLADRITRIEVHLADLNGHHKHGADDKRCMIEARPIGLDPIAVETHAPDYHAAVSDAAGKLRRAVTSRMERADAR